MSDAATSEGAPATNARGSKAERPKVPPTPNDVVTIGFRARRQVKDEMTALAKQTGGDLQEFMRNAAMAWRQLMLAGPDARLVIHRGDVEIEIPRPM